jgi:pimeloyl-ACP methyl ester carboxylesterase
MLIDDVNGTRLNVIDEGDGPPLLLLHGMGGTWRELAPQLDGLSDRFRCIAIEHRGHGHSERTSGRYTIDLFTHDVVAVCTALGITHTHVAGLSMGGMIGLNLALRHPWLVDSLVLIDSAARPDESYRLGLEAIARFVRDQGFTDTPQQGGTSAALAWSPKTVCERPEIIRDNMREALSTDPDVYARTALAVAQFDLLDRLGDIRAAALVLWGDHDVLVPRTYSDALVAGIDRAELVVVPDAGHLCTLERPEYVNGLIRDFLARHPSSSTPDAPVALGTTC